EAIPPLERHNFGRPGQQPGRRPQIGTLQVCCQRGDIRHGNDDTKLVSHFPELGGHRGILAIAGQKREDIDMVTQVFGCQHMGLHGTRTINKFRWHSVPPQCLAGVVRPLSTWRIQIRRSGIDIASRAPAPANPAITRKAARNASAISACTTACRAAGSEDMTLAPCSIMAPNSAAVSRSVAASIANNTEATAAVPKAAPIEREN